MSERFVFLNKFNHLTDFKLRNVNVRRNWHQRLQKRVIFFPKLRQRTLKYSNNTHTLPNTRYVTMIPSNPLLLTQLFLTRFELKLKRIVRKKDKTLRRFWLTTRVLFNLTRQSKGARMGKGKGKNYQSLQRINPLTNFIGFRGVRFGRLIRFLLYFNSLFRIQFFLTTAWYTMLNRDNYFYFRSA